MQRHGLLWIRKGEPATGQVRMRVTLEFELQRLGAALDPDFTAHDSLHAVVNLATHHAVMNSEGHAGMLTEQATKEKSILRRDAIQGDSQVTGRHMGASFKN